MLTAQPAFARAYDRCASFDEWDDYVAEVESMGLERCLEIDQAAYERYLAR